MTQGFVYKHRIIVDIYLQCFYHLDIQTQILSDSEYRDHKDIIYKRCKSSARDLFFT